MILPWPIATMLYVINVQCLFSNNEFGSKLRRAKTAVLERDGRTDLSFIPTVFWLICLNGKVTPNFAINLSQFVIQWCTITICLVMLQRFLFYFVSLLCNLSNLPHEKHMVKDILYRYCIFYMNPEHTDLQNTSGIYGANIITILSLLRIILFN